MLEIITNNPYRILGVYANTPMENIIANQGKMNAFLKVSQSGPFQSDFDNLLPSIELTQERVVDANSKLTLSKDRLKYGQFWFVKSTPIDDTAIDHLKNGDIDAAIDIWSKEVNVTSLHNRLVCCLVKGEYIQVMQLAQRIYVDYCQEYQLIICNKYNLVDINWLFDNLVEQIKGEMSLFDLLDATYLTERRTLLALEFMKPFESKIQELILNSQIRPKKIVEARDLALACSPYLGELYSLCKYCEAWRSIVQSITEKLAGQMLHMVLEDVKDINSKFLPPFPSTFESIIIKAHLTNRYLKANNVIQTIKEMDITETFENVSVTSAEILIKNLYYEAIGQPISSIINTSHLDLRDSRSFYASCETTDDYRNYCKRYPFVYNYNEVYGKIDLLDFQSCKSINDYKQYIQNNPNGRYVNEAKEQLEKLMFNNCSTIINCEDYLSYFPSGKNTK